MAELVDAAALGAVGVKPVEVRVLFPVRKIQGNNTLYFFLCILYTVHRMDDKQAKIFAAEIGADIPVLDLHGFYPDEALDKVESFVFNMYKNKQNMGRIIYGGGIGVLRTGVLNYLQKHPLVEDVVDEGGSCLVLI